MKKVLLRFYDKNNLGDDLFIKILTQRYKNPFSVILSKRNSDLTNIKNLKTYHNKFLFLFYKGIEKMFGARNLWLRRLAKKHDSLILIGGSIFIENNNLPLWEKEKGFYQKLPIPYYILGCNFGPYKNSEFVNVISEIFDSAKDVCFRDQASYALFSDLNHTRLASDVVLTLDTSNYSAKHEQCVIFSIIDCERRFDKETTSRYEELIINLTKKFIAANYKVVYMSFCKFEGDEIAINRIQSKLDKKTCSEVEVYHYDGQLDEALSLLASCEILVSTRLHASILGLIFSKKVLPIAYDQKITNLLQDMNFSGDIINIKNIDGFDVKNFNLNDMKTNDIKPYVQLADRQFHEIDKILVRN